jgi:hypothetical protein
MNLALAHEQADASHAKTPELARQRLAETLNRRMPDTKGRAKDFVFISVVLPTSEEEQRWLDRRFIQIRLI